MRQDKDRSSKWLLTHHGDAILKLAGYTNFTKWQPLQPETVAPRRFVADGLLEVQFAGETRPTRVLVEIETFADSAADDQVFDDVLLMAVEWKVVPEVLSLVLRPKGNVAVTGDIKRVSKRGGTQITGSWPVVKLWELEKEILRQRYEADGIQKGLQQAIRKASSKNSNDLL